MQMRSCAFDVIVLVLAGPAFSRQYAAAMQIFEVTVRKLISCLGVGGFSVVDAQVPFPVFSKPMLVDELILFLRGRLVLAPIISLVVNQLPVLDQLFGES